MPLTLAESTLTLNPGGGGSVAAMFHSVLGIRSIETLRRTSFPFALTIRPGAALSSQRRDLNTA